MGQFSHDANVNRFQASPVACYNINFKGSYNFELSEKMPDLEELMRSIEGYLLVQEKQYPLGGHG